MRYFCWFWYRIAGRALYIIRSRKAETRRAFSHLEDTGRAFNGSFNPATKRKIAISYGIYNPMICDAFARLHGRVTNENEKERFIHYFICSSLFDDFTDYQLITNEQLQAISFRPEEYNARTFDEKVFLNSHRLLYECVRDKESYHRITQELFDAQLLSRQQYKSTLSDEAIRNITFNKGGDAVLLCRYYLDMESCDTEDACWYRIGTLIQLTNDLYDIYKDIQDDIVTLPCRMADAYAFEIFFKAQIAEMNRLISRLPYPLKRRQEFSLSMAGIYSFGLIAIEQLKKIQGNAAQLPGLGTLPRKALIIDMENTGNLIRWFRFAYRYARLPDR